MADVDDFFRLREYDSLMREVDRLRQGIAQESERLSRRKSELSDRIELLNSRESQFRQFNHQIAELDRRLAQHLSPEAKTKLEEEGLKLLSEQEEISQLISEDQVFIKGFTQTVQELESEILAEIQSSEAVIAQNLKRADSVYATLPTEWHAQYQRILAKKPAHGVFSRIENLKCQFCRYTISKVLESEVDVGLQLKGCPGCGRLLLPYKTVAG